jgi:hypothetical protein
MRPIELGWLPLLASLAIPALHAETIERSLPAAAAGSVSIVNVAGDVKVEGWKQPEVKVTAELGSGVEKLLFENQGSEIVIKVVLPRGGSGGGASRLRVRVPEGSKLSISTTSADQAVARVLGTQRLQAVSGDIATEQWAEELRIKSISGDVVVEGHEKPALTEVQTVSGDVRLERLAGEISLQTTSGDMEVSMSELARGTIRTTNGDVRLRTRLAPDGRFEAEAFNGDVRLLFRDALDAEFDIETFNGDIESCFGPKPVRTREFAPGNALRFKQGNGTGRVRVKTYNGTVDVCKD